MTHPDDKCLESEVMDAGQQVSHPVGGPIEKLRKCEAIPKSLTEFQAFVGNLISEPIAESVVTEVWKHLFEESPGVPNLCLSNDDSNSSNCNLVAVSASQCVQNNEINKGGSSEEEVDSSDCEIIEIVSLKSNKCENSSDSESEDGGTESDHSVEILESTFNSKESSDDEECMLHGGKSTQNASILHCYEGRTSAGESHVIATEIISSELTSLKAKTNVESKFNRKKKKYKKLRTEIKRLKSLLVDILVTVNNRTVNSSSHKRGREQSLSDITLGHTVKEVCDSKVDHLQTYRNGLQDSHVESKGIPGLSKKTVAPGGGNIVSEKPTKLFSSKRFGSKVKQEKQNSSRIFHQDSNGSAYELNTSKRKKFQWRKVITDTLKSKIDMQLPVEKLKRKVIAKYYCHRGNISQNTSLKFFKYLSSTSGVIINNDIARYCIQQKVHIPKSERREVVMKTVTTTRKY